MTGTSCEPYGWTRYLYVWRFTRQYLQTATQLSPATLAAGTGYGTTSPVNGVSRNFLSIGASNALTFFLSTFISLVCRRSVERFPLAIIINMDILNYSDITPILT